MDYAADQMKQRIGAFDWESSPLGPRADWPPTLTLMIDVMLNSRFPMLIFWGRDLIQIYNDAYIPLFGARHPRALGQGAQECWPEVWTTVEPLLNNTLHNGTPVWAEDMPFTLERNGFTEQAYFTFSYSRIGEGEGSSGVLCTNVETTKSVKRELDFRTMADNLANIIYTHAPDGSIEWANSRWFEYTKLPVAIATSPSRWAHILPPSDLERILAILQRSFADGTPYEAEIRIRPYGGDESAYRWHLLRAVPIRDRAGSITRWAGSATDVHDRHLAERALRESIVGEFAREHQAFLEFQKAALLQQLPEIDGADV